MLTAIEQTYVKIGRLYAQSVEFSERVHKYLDILEFAEFSDVVDFAAASGKARKKPNCTPGKSHHCPGKGGAGACVAMGKQCRDKPGAAEKTAAGFVAKATKAKKEKVVKEVAPKTPKAPKATKSKAKKVDEVIEPVTPTPVPAKTAKAKPKVEEAIQPKPKAEEITPTPKTETPASKKEDAPAPVKAKVEEEKSTTTKFEFPDDARLAAAERSPLAGLAGSLNMDGIAKLKVDGKEYFSKTVRTKEAANAELATKEIADDLGVGDYFLPVKVLNQGEKPTIVNPLIKPDPRKEESENPWDARNTPDIDPALASRLATFDLIAAQLDRHAGNIIKSGDKIYGIDNEFAFGKQFGHGDRKTGLNTRAIKNSMFRLAYERSAQSDDTPLDIEMIDNAVKNVDRHAKALADKGLNSEQYRERLKLLQKVAKSKMPTFNNLLKRI
jgi:chemotaxis protein histidine kinase CheA